jgi:hypothetical protein
MKKTLVVLSLIVFVFAVITPISGAERSSVNYPVKKLYSAPSEDSNLVLAIPIDVRLLEISDDANWYKVQIQYSVGPFNYTYVGWAKIPVGDYQFSRANILP